VAARPSPSPSPRPARPAWLVPAAILAGLVALVAYSAHQRYAFLSSSPYPMGVDGYFYPIQLRAVLEHGTLQYPASPLAFYLMAPLAWLTDPITGAKLGAAIGGALIALPAYAVGRQLGGGSRAAGLVAAAIATTSAGSWYLSIEFVKNGWGLTAALTAIWLVLRAVDTPSRRRITLATAGLVVAALTHKMAVGLVVAIGGPAIVVAVLASRTRTQRLRIAAIAAAAIAVAVIAAIAFPERFIAGRDLGAAAELFSTTALWDAPALRIARGSNVFVLGLEHEARDAGIAGLVAIAALAAAARLRTRPWWREHATPASAPLTAAAIATAALAVFIAVPWIDVADPQGLGFRLRIAAFVPLALAAAITIGRLAPFVDALAARTGPRRDPARARGTADLLAAGVAAILALAAPAARADGVVRAHPAMVAATMAVEGAVPAGDTVVVPERHILYMVAYYARVPVTLRPEPIAPDRRWRLMPLAFIGAKTSLYRLLDSARTTAGVAPPRGFHPRDRNGLVLVPEATWAWIVERLPPTPQKHYRAWPTI
jgi:hypothetical protein